MEVEILTENLTKYIGLLTRIVPSNSQVPILNSLMLEADSSGFYIKATDLELGAVIKIPAKINNQGKTTIPGKQFLEALSNLPKDKILIKEDKEKVVLKIRENKLIFQTLSASEFPELLKEKGGKVLSLKKSEFDKLFKHLSFSASTDEIRPHLTGVYIVKKDKNVEMVTTDGYRLTVKEAIEKDGVGLEEALIVSMEAVSEAMNIDSVDMSVFVNEAEGQVVFEGGDVVLVGRLIEGKFPPYEKVMPKTAATKIKVDKQEFMQNTKLANVFAKDQSNIINLSVEGNVLKISSKTAGLGEGEFELDCVKDGEDNKIAFNVRYVLDALKNFEGETVTLEINGPLQPALLTDDKNSFKHVIMPVKTD